jgi:hypothetical protein
MTVSEFTALALGQCRRPNELDGMTALVGDLIRAAVRRGAAVSTDWAEIAMPSVADVAADAAVRARLASSSSSSSSSSSTVRRHRGGSVQTPRRVKAWLEHMAPRSWLARRNARRRSSLLRLAPRLEQQGIVPR